LQQGSIVRSRHRRRCIRPRGRPCRARTARSPDQYFALEDADRCELVRGEVIRVGSPGLEHSRIQSLVAHHLWQFIRSLPERPGEVLTEIDCLIERDPPTIRRPDVAFVTRERLVTDDDRRLPCAPDLVVEVVSPSDRSGEVADKVQAWLRADAREAWVIEPRMSLVVVHRPGRAPLPLGLDDRIDGGDVLPGFELAVATLLG
jgi:Uma2 family endonuclease